MLCRNILIYGSLAMLLVQADPDQGHDSTSDEAPTESVSYIFSDQPNDEPRYYTGETGGASSTSSEASYGGHHPSNDVNGVTDGSKSSIEDQDEDQSLNSEEGKR